MLFKDQKETFIFIDKKNKIREFNKEGAKYLHIETTEISCTLCYTDEQNRNEDYQKLKDFTIEAEWYIWRYLR